MTKKKKNMACIELEDLVGCMEIIVFPEQYEKYHQRLKEGNMVFCHGTVKREGEKENRLQLDFLKLFSEKNTDPALWLQFINLEDYMQKIKQILPILKRYPGNGIIYFYLKMTKQVKEETDLCINPEPECLAALNDICGRDNIIVK